MIQGSGRSLGGENGYPLQYSCLENSTDRETWWIAVQWVAKSQGGLVVKNPPAKEGDTGDTSSIPESGRSPGEGNGYPLQYSCLENSMDRPRGCKELDMTERLKHK